MFRFPEIGINSDQSAVFAFVRFFREFAVACFIEVYRPRFRYLYAPPEFPYERTGDAIVKQDF